jgi:rod shape-determining protein MreB and related proteins
VAVTSEELRRAVEAPVRDIVSSVRDALEETPPELASDLAQSGILLAGGGALLRGFAERLEAETGVPVRLADSPLDCVALGAGRALDEMELLERTAARTGGTLTALRRPGP